MCGSDGLVLDESAGKSETWEENFCYAVDEAKIWGEKTGGGPGIGFEIWTETLRHL